MSKCENCEGTGTVSLPEHPGRVTTCFFCNGTGEMCDICGEAINICEGIHDDDEND
jgi:RecJ-like exonuclease